jgi:hypothetical protein
MDLVIVLCGLALIIMGGFGLYNNWGRFSTGMKSAEKMAPLFTSGATLVIGIIILFRWLDPWVAVIGLILFGLGYLLRGPVSARYR